MLMKTSLSFQKILRMAAYLMSLILLYLWGSLFIEHLWWFFPPMPPAPIQVWFGQTIHFGLLASYIIIIWNERLGALLMVIFSFSFFIIVVGSAGGVVFFLLSSLPAGFLALIWLIEKRQKSLPNPNGGE
jgi:hypothetical protein